MLPDIFRALFGRDPMVGEVWVRSVEDVDNPFEEPSKILILDVQNGYVKYSIGSTSSSRSCVDFKFGFKRLKCR